MTSRKPGKGKPMNAQEAVRRLVSRRCAHDRSFKRNQCANCLRDVVEAYGRECAGSVEAVNVQAMIRDIAIHPRGRKSEQYHEGFDAAITALIGLYAVAVKKS